MPLNLEEILALPDIGQKINYLKKGRKTELPDRCKLWDDWNPERHEIMVDKKKYPDRKVLEKEAEKHFDEKTGKTYETLLSEEGKTYRYSDGFCVPVAWQKTPDRQSVRARSCRAATLPVT